MADIGLRSDRIHISNLKTSEGNSESWNDRTTVCIGCHPRAYGDRIVPIGLMSHGRNSHVTKNILTMLYINKFGHTQQQPILVAFYDKTLKSVTMHNNPTVLSCTNNNLWQDSELHLELRPRRTCRWSLRWLRTSGPQSSNPHSETQLDVKM